MPAFGHYCRRHMAVEGTGEYHHLGVGESLAIEVSGPTMEACLARAIEGVAARFADIHPSQYGELRSVVVIGSSPSKLLHSLLSQSVRLLRSGELAVQLVDCMVAEGRLNATWEVVRLDAIRPARSPRRLRWHDVCLEPDRTGWTGRAIASR